MRNRKGFTLVELLAVIAILAILVILALPNVINLYNRARKSAFLTEAQNVLKTTTNKVIQEGVSGKKINVVSNNRNSLNLTGEKINYNVKLDNQGKITDYVISNDNFCISSKKAYDKLTIDDVSEDCSYDNLNNIVGTLTNKFYEKSGRDDRGLVSSIEFYSDGRIIEGAEKYDVSEAQDNSVIMYVKSSSENSSFQDLIIVANGKISLPEDSSNLFAFFTSAGSAFYANLTNLQFNHSIDTHKVTNMSHMFEYIRVNSIDLSDFDTSKVINMSGLVRGTYMLSSLDLSSFDTSNVNDMSDMFSFSSITEITGLDRLNTSSVTDMNSMFFKSLVPILDLTNFDTSNVTDMSSMFEYSSTAKIDVSSFDTSKVESMHWMFANSKVEIIDVSNFNTSKVTGMAAMFSGAQALEIKGLENFDTSKVENFNQMFQGLLIDTLDLSNFELSDGISNGDMFRNSKTKTVYVKNENILAKFKKSSNTPATLTFAIKSK